MDSFSHLYEELSDYVYGYIYLRVSNRQLAEDLTSKSFLTAFEKRGKYEKDKGSYKQWITGIAKNCLLNHWRSHKTEVSLEDLESLGSLVSVSPTSSEQIDQETLFENILNECKPSVRSLLILRYIDDLSHEDIARITGKTHDSIRKSFSRIHKALREKFSHKNITS